MTYRRDDGALPGYRELGAVCRALHLDLSGARMLPSRSNAVFHLPAEAVVVLDLAFAVPDHFHDPDTKRAEFSVAYGYDITTWIGWTLIRDLTELHSLASYMRRAPTNPAARDELHRRVDSLVNDERSVVWRAACQAEYQV